MVDIILQLHKICGALEIESLVYSIGLSDRGRTTCTNVNKLTRA